MNFNIFKKKVVVKSFAEEGSGGVGQLCRAA